MRVSNEKRKPSKAAKWCKESHIDAFLQHMEVPQPEEADTTNPVEEGTITPVKPRLNRKQARAEKAAAKAATAEAPSANAASVNVVAAEVPESDGAKRNNTKSKKALPADEKKKKESPPQVSNPGMLACALIIASCVASFVAIYSQRPNHRSGEQIHSKDT